MTFTVRGSHRFLAAAVAAVVLAVAGGSGPATAAPPPGAAGAGAAPVAAGGGATPPAGQPAAESADSDTVRPADRARLLPANWRTSGDVAWTTSGDGNGFHVLAATARTGYTWRTVATLAEPGFDTDQWIGNACLTGSGRRLVVVYAPRTFTNKADLFDRGGFTAVVDLVSRAVTKIPVQSSLAYFNPGCGTGEKAVLTQLGGERVDDPAAADLRSRLITVDAATGTMTAPVVLRTEVSSAVPVRDGVVAAGAGRLVRVTPDGRVSRLATTAGVAFRLVADAAGAVVFLDRTGGRVRAKRTMAVAGAPVTTLAEGGIAAVGLAPGPAGRVFLTGTPDSVAALPGVVRRLAAPASSAVSSTGAVALTRVGWAGESDPRARADVAGAARRVTIQATSLARRARLAFTVSPEVSGPPAAAGRGPHPALRPATGALARGARGLAAGGSPTDPVEAERYCAVPRNDPRNQAMQPKPRQVEWAVDQAITDSLRVTREANWKNLGMPAYSPQGLFPSIPLLGGGRVPAQVMLGIIAQESNMWQAPGFVLPGATGNPLIGNYYGRDIYNSDPADDWDINWADADCGYGVAQVTDGMRLAGREKPNERAHEYQTQRAVALDFATNVAAGVRILQDKWNQVRTANMLVNNGSAAKLENWFFAVWAYNSGFHPDRGDGKPWGVGWLNNPINPRFDPQRSAFLDNNSYDDARTPQKWPYPEKVLGWAGHPVEINESPTTLVAGFRPAWWISDAERRRVKPPIDLFCDQTNRCDPTASVQADDPEVAGEPPGPCLNKNDSGRYDLRCWYNQSVQWKGGPGTSCNACGNEVLRFDPGFPYEPDGASYPPNCGPGGLPGTGALIIDDVPDDVPSVRAGCPRSWRNAGTFAFGFPADQHGNYPAKVDLHQIGGGFGGHFSFGRTRHVGADDGKLRIAGTWRLAEPASGWHRVRVAIPDHRAWTQQADYVLDLGDGRTRHRVISQAWNRNTWVDLGVFNLAGRAGITLATETMDGTGEDSIAWDAVAFIPTTAPTVQYVAMGDSYASGEGVEPYVPTSDHKRDNGTRNACHRSYHAYPQHLTRPGAATPIAQEAAAGRASFGFIACSGALTTSVTRDAVNRPASTTDIGRHTDWAVVDYRHGELPQADQGWLDEETTLVTLSIGGNDARFTDVLHGCIVVNPAEGCYADGHRLTRRSGVVDPVALRHFETAVILNHLPAKLTATYRAIHAKAPNATIVVTGYPQLFPDRPLQTCQGVTVTTQRFLNNLSGMLTATTAKAVAAVHAEGVDIVFADPNIAWRTGVGDSSRWACPTGSAGSWTNLLINWSETGSGRDVPGAGSFHPKQEGQLALATMAGLGLRAPTAVGAVADRIRDGAARLGVTITPAAAQDAARACLDRSRIGGVVGDPCANQPIFFPSATDAGGAARNDAEAMDANPPWVLLRYARNTEMEKLLDRGWMDKEPARSQQTACPKPRPTNMQCDEYPYYSSDLAGAWDEFLGENSPVSTKLKLIPRGENTAEGSRLPHFYSRCGLQSATYDATTKVQTGVGDRYLTVPLLHGGAPGTFYICPPPS